MDKPTAEFDETAYLNSGGGHCPFCNNTDITGGFIEVRGNGTSQDVHCSNCGAVWTDGYILTTVLITQEPTNDLHLQGELI